MNANMPDPQLFHTTAMGAERIIRNLDLKDTDEVLFCKNIAQSPDSIITARGKNWYIKNDFCTITVNITSNTIITAHKIQ